MKRAADPADRSQYLRISEMLPTLEQLWLPGPAGALYTCEQRMVARDTLGHSA